MPLVQEEQAVGSKRMRSSKVFQSVFNCSAHHCVAHVAQCCTGHQEFNGVCARVLVQHFHAIWLSMSVVIFHCVGMCASFWYVDFVPSENYWEVVSTVSGKLSKYVDIFVNLSSMRPLFFLLHHSILIICRSWCFVLSSYTTLQILKSGRYNTCGLFKSYCWIVLSRAGNTSWFVEGATWRRQSL